MIEHTQRLLQSYRHFTGEELLSGGTPAELCQRLFLAPFVVVSHGTELDPVLNYGNAAALELWEMMWDELIKTPSRLTAEAPEREERARLLAQVSAHGFIRNYSGVRVTRCGRRFRIREALVWNLITEQGQPCGQAATFARWDWL